MVKTRRRADRAIVADSTCTTSKDDTSGGGGGGNGPSEKFLFVFDNVDGMASSTAAETLPHSSSSLNSLVDETSQSKESPKIINDDEIESAKMANTSLESAPQTKKEEEEEVLTQEEGVEQKALTQEEDVKQEDLKQEDLKQETQDTPPTPASASTPPPPLESFTPMTLYEIKSAIIDLSSEIPSKESCSSLDPNNKAIVYEWAMSMRITIEELTLLLSLTPAATYTWGTKKTGAQDQNSLLFDTESIEAQNNIARVITNRLGPVLNYDEEMCTKKEMTCTNQEDGKKTTTYEYYYTMSQPNYVDYCYTLLCRKAVMMRHVLLSEMHRCVKCLQDYLDEMEKDGTNDEEGGNSNFSFYHG